MLIPPAVRTRTPPVQDICRQLDTLETTLRRLLPRELTTAQRRALAVVDEAPGGLATVSSITDSDAGTVSGRVARALVDAGHLEILCIRHFHYVRRPRADTDSRP